jgi:ribonuclease G
LHLHPYVFAYATKGLLNLKMQWAIKYGVHVVENQSLGMLETKFFNSKGQEVFLQEEKQTDKVCEK